MAPEIVEVEEVAPSKVIVPFEWVKVPVFAQFAAKVELAEFEAVKVELVEIVKSPLTSNIGSLVFASTVTPFVPLPIVK